jgi:hypothetical protein
MGLVRYAAVSASHWRQGLQQMAAIRAWRIFCVAQRQTTHQHLQKTKRTMWQGANLLIGGTVGA